MAKKRMFSNDIIDTDKFLMLTNEAKMLYFYLGMKADDDGFISNAVMLLRILAIDKKYIDELVNNDYLIDFENGIYVITDWLENNYLDKNKVKPTLNQEEYKKTEIIGNHYVLKLNQGLNQSLTKVNKKFTQNRIEENRIEKNNVENSSIDNKLSMTFPIDSQEYFLSEYLYKKILENDSKYKKPNLQKWSEHIDKLIRLDKRNPIEIKQVIDFATNDKFWKSNILSTKKLREKFTTLQIQLKNSPNMKNKQMKEKQFETINDFINNNDEEMFKGEF